MRKKGEIWIYWQIGARFIETTKSHMLQKTLFFLFISCLTGNLFAQNASFTDKRDGQTYRTVKLGDQIWMLDNFNFDIGDGSWCYEEKEGNCEKWGRLYTLEAAQAAAPKGWHLATVSDWDAAIEHFGGVKEAFMGSKHYFPNADEVGPAFFKGLEIGSLGGVRVGDERKAAKPRLAEYLFAEGGENGGFWAESSGLDKFDRPCPTELRNNCAVLSMSKRQYFHWELCDDAFETDGYSVRLVKD